MMDRSDCRTVGTTDKDPLILALAAWQFFSLRTWHCLASSVGSDPASTVAWVPIEEMLLSHLTRWTAIDLLRVPSFGRSCLCEVAMAMERYGFRLKGDDGPTPALLDPSRASNLASMVPAIIKAMETKRMTIERAAAMVHLMDIDGLTVREIAKVHGVSRGRISALIAQVRPILALRARYQLGEVALPR